MQPECSVFVGDLIIRAANVHLEIELVVHVRVRGVYGIGAVGTM